MGVWKILFKQSNGLISVIWTLLRWKQWLKGGMLTLNNLKLCEIAEELKISEGSVFTILHEHLSMRKLCSKWVLYLLTVNQQHIDNSEHCLQLFLCKYDNGWNMDPPLHSGVKLAVSWVDSSRWKPSKATKDANTNRQGFGLYILGCAKYFVHRLPWERKNHR